MQTPNTINPQIIERFIEEEKYHFLDDNVTTIVQLKLKNGFTVLGSSACADPKNFSQEKGKKYSREKAIEQIWMLLGFELRTKLSLIEKAGEPKGLITEYSPKTYVGTKVVRATPMNRKDYNNLRGWQVPTDENPNDEGYLVEYADGGSTNVEGFSGYISWSPKEIFESSYETFI